MKIAKHFNKGLKEIDPTTKNYTLYPWYVMFFVATIICFCLAIAGFYNFIN